MEGEIVDQILNFLSNFFNLPPEWLGYPSIIFYLFVPAAALIYMWYNFLHNKIKIFTNQIVNIGISFILGILSVWLVRVFGPIWTTGFAVGIAILVMGRFTLKRMIIAAVITVAVFLALSLAVSLIWVGVNI